MGTVKVRHLVERHGRYYFQPSASMRRAGFRTKTKSLGSDLAQAIAIVEAINADWDAGRAGTTATRGTFTWLIAEYRGSLWFGQLGARTKIEQNRALKWIEGAMGAASVASITHEDTDRFVGKLLAKSQSSGLLGQKVLRRVLNYGIRRGVLTHNPAAQMGLKQTRPRRQRWTPEQVDAFVAAAMAMDRPGWALAVRIAYDTSQRLADVLALDWHAWDGEGFKFEQAKRDQKEVWAPVEPETLALMRRIGRNGVNVITDTHGRPVPLKVSFNRAFRKIKEKAGLPDDLQYRDLRRTAGSEVLGAGGRAEPLTGHEPGSPVLKVYEIPDKEGAREAQRARNRYRRRTKSLKTATREFEK